MFFRKYWVPLTVFFVLIVGVSVYYLQTQTPKDPVVIYKTTEVEKPTTKAPVKETQQGGHVHEDGTFHAEPHAAEDTPAAQYTASPGAATKPDFPLVAEGDDPVEAAYKRLEYIKNNPYAWGGVHSERATELIAQLMPPPVLIDEGHGEAVGMLIDELIAQGDPRAAEVLITNICEGYVAGWSMFDGLVAIGPPAVPYILPYLREGNEWAGMAAQFLSRIAVAHSADLGGITKHIIIPKIAEIAADSEYKRFGPGTVIDAKAALSMLQ